MNERRLSELISAVDYVRHVIDGDLNYFKKLKLIKSKVRTLGIGRYYGVRIVNCLAAYLTPDADIRKTIESGEMLRIRNCGNRAYSVLCDWLEIKQHYVYTAHRREHIFELK